MQKTLAKKVVNHFSAAELLAKSVLNDMLRNKGVVSAETMILVKDFATTSDDIKLEYQVIKDVAARIESSTPDDRHN